MNWAEEGYVRIYKRNTVEIAAWSWETRAVFWELMRLADEDGTVPCPSIKGLCALLMMPAEVVEPALTTLCQGGPMDKLENGFQIRNYLAAQRTPRQDAARKREERKRRLTMLVQDNVGQLRTSLDNVTLRSALLCSESAPLCSAPTPKEPDPESCALSEKGTTEELESQKAKTNGAGDVLAIWNHFAAWRKAAGLVARSNPTPAQRALIVDRLRHWPPEQLKMAIQNMLQDPFYLGQNLQNKRYADLVHAIRNDGVIQRHLDNPPRKS